MQIYLVSWWTLDKDNNISDTTAAHIATSLELAEKWIKENSDWPDLAEGGLWFVEDFWTDEWQCDRIDGPDYHYYTLEGEPSDTRGRPLKQHMEEETVLSDELRPTTDKLAEKMKEMSSLMAEFAEELRNL